ncbi:hypothetical protein OWM07_09485 [Deferribacter thermophilus]|uniref:hypothetical protein n=1 Tax=Deferribacter thermophilus TaxID=53573 RepID=UPI003C1AFC65
MINDNYLIKLYNILFISTSILIVFSHKWLGNIRIVLFALSIYMFIKYIPDKTKIYKNRVFIYLLLFLIYVLVINLLFFDHIKGVNRILNWTIIFFNSIIFMIINKNNKVLISYYFLILSISIVSDFLLKNGFSAL